MPESVTPVQESQRSRGSLATGSFSTALDCIPHQVGWHSPGESQAPVGYVGNGAGVYRRAPEQDREGS